MAASPVDPLAEAHTTARVLAKRGTFDSIKNTLRPLAWAIGITVAVLGSLLAAKQIEVQVMFVWLFGVPVIFGLVAFAAIEVTRLVECARALRELVDAHIYYESKLADAYESRDRAVERSNQLSLEVTATQTALSLIALGVKRPQVGEQNEGS